MAVRINWGRGRLLKYESIGAFVAKFCALNGVSPVRAATFLRARTGDAWPPTMLAEPELGRLARLLDEPLRVMRTVFATRLSLADSTLFAVEDPKETGRRTLRYCPDCAAAGYHSQVHELRWLRSCPFHGTPIQIWSATKPHGSGIFARYVSDLTSLLRGMAPQWPAAPRPSVAPASPAFRHLLQWRIGVQHIAETLTVKHLWSSDSSAYSARDSIGTGVGRLHALHRVPAKILSCFADFEQDWTMRCTPIAPETAVALRKVLAYTDFDHLLWFYKRNSALSANPPDYLARLQRAQSHLESRHRRDGCAWRWSYDEGWQRCAPGGPHAHGKCPFEIALDELALGWGNVFPALSRQRAHEEWWCYVNAAERFEAQGLVVCADPARLSPFYRAAYTPAARAAADWTGHASLTALLNRVLEEEIDATEQALHRWIDAIAAGNPPTVRLDPPSSVNLLQGKDQVVLMNWSREGGQGGA